MSHKFSPANFETRFKAWAKSELNMTISQSQQFVESIQENRTIAKMLTYCVSRGKSKCSADKFINFHNLNTLTKKIDENSESFRSQRLQNDNGERANLKIYKNIEIYREIFLLTIGSEICETLKDYKNYDQIIDTNETAKISKLLNTMEKYCTNIDSIEPPISTTDDQKCDPNNGEFHEFFQALTLDNLSNNDTTSSAFNDLTLCIETTKQTILECLDRLSKVKHELTSPPKSVQLSNTIIDDHSTQTALDESISSIKTLINSWLECIKEYE